MAEDIGVDNGNTDVSSGSSAGSDFGMGDFFGSTPATVVEETVSPQQDVAPVVETSTAQVELPKVEDAPKNDGTMPAETSGGLPGGVQTASVTEAPITPEQDIEALRAQLATAVGQQAALTLQLQQLQQPAKGPEMKLPEDPKELSTVDFLQGANPTDLLEPESFNALLNKVATISARAGQQAGYEMAMRTIPQVVQQSAQQQYNLQTSADNFYKQNADLTPFKQAVSMAALDFYSKNPGSTVEQILEGAGKATRQILRLRGTTAGRVPAQPAATVSAGGQDRLAQPPQLSSMEQQILEVINAAQ